MLRQAQQERIIFCFISLIVRAEHFGFAEESLVEVQFLEIPLSLILRQHRTALRRHQRLRGWRGLGGAGAGIGRLVEPPVQFVTTIAHRNGVLTLARGAVGRAGQPHVEMIFVVIPRPDFSQPAAVAGGRAA